MITQPTYDPAKTAGLLRSVQGCGYIASECAFEYVDALRACEAERAAQQARADAAELRDRQRKLPFPKNNRFVCPHCGTEADLTNLRLQIEAQAKRPIVL